ncbi:MAG: hypothetical protein DCC71_14900 [Proteobacteria bacterium]|nr:MAG: hypothetical protein DCC71_14900 [Pseudomonadota bacterium]
MRASISWRSTWTDAIGRSRTTWSRCGTVSASLVHPREVFQPAILVGACAVIVAHNHPSGDPTPSREDREITQRLAQAGALLGVSLLDSVVFTRKGGFVALRELEASLFDRPWER